MALQKINKIPQTLREMVQERMRSAIIEGHFEPGERLVERPLCDQLGVSRTVIRETIRYLEAEGLVENIPNRGPVVASLNWDQAKQIYDIRMQLESSAVKVCAKAVTPAFSEKLSCALKKIGNAQKSTDSVEMIKATASFYELIFAHAGHSIAAEVVERLNGRISRLRVLTLSTEERSRPGIEHMTNICNAILHKDSKGAAKAVQDHIEDASKVAKRLLQQHGKGQQGNG